MAEFKPYKVTTIDAVISAGKSLTISESSLSFKTVIDGEVALQYYNVISKYYDVVKPFIEVTTLNDSDFLNYKCKPNMYCFDTYGTPELAYSLLYINNMVSVTEFTKPSFKRFSSNIMKVVKELMSLCDNDLKQNRIDNKIS